MGTMPADLPSVQNQVALLFPGTCYFLFTTPTPYGKRGGIIIHLVFVMHPGREHQKPLKFLE